jgi:hypothetical protein
MPKKLTVQVVRPRKRKGFVDHTVKVSVNVHPTPDAGTPSAHAPAPAPAPTPAPAPAYLQSEPHLSLTAAGVGPETEAFFAGLPPEIANTPDPKTFVEFILRRQMDERARISTADDRVN